MDVVWTPAWGISNFGAAEDETETNRDPRERVWYFDDTTFATQFGAFISGSTPVYDTLAVYTPGTPWDTTTGTPGAPAWYGRNGFSPVDLASQTTAQLPECGTVITP